jgi:hypothetical protein
LSSSLTVIKLVVEGSGPRRVSFPSWPHVVFPSKVMIGLSEFFLIMSQSWHPPRPPADHKSTSDNKQTILPPPYLPAYSHFQINRFLTGKQATEISLRDRTPVLMTSLSLTLCMLQSL